MNNLPKFVIVSCPRSGTRWMAEKISANGVVCKHEFVWGYEGYKGEGIPKGLWGTVDFGYIQALNSVSIDFIIHSYRHPVNAINSLLPTSRRIHEAFSVCGKPHRKLLTKKDSAQFTWLRWNEIMLEHDVTLRWQVEFDNIVELFRLCKTPYPDIQVPITKDPRTKQGFTWNELWPETVKLARRLGYENSIRGNKKCDF